MLQNVQSLLKACQAGLLSRERNMKTLSYCKICKQTIYIHTDSQVFHQYHLEHQHDYSHHIYHTSMSESYNLPLEFHFRSLQKIYPKKH